MAEGTVANLLIAGMTIYGPATLGLAMLLGTMGIPVPLPILALAAGAFARYGSIKAGLAVFAAFAHRELSDILGFLYTTRDAPAMRKALLPHKAQDGFFDFFAPLVAVGIVRGLIGLL